MSKRQENREEGHGPVIDKMCQEMCQEGGPKFRALQAIARHPIGFPMLSWLDIERNEDMGKIKGLEPFLHSRKSFAVTFLQEKGERHS